MVEYRSFRNPDVPHLFALWRTAGLGRAAAQPVSVMAMDVSVFALRYFDPAGLIVAESEEGHLLGFVHAGFGFREDRSDIDSARGVICAVVVHPGWRRKGIGRELVRRAEEYLRQRGATSIQVGQSVHCDPFYWGLHGGSRPSGVCDSDPNMQLFLKSLGYEAADFVTIMQRDLSTNRDPTNFRLIGLRRQTELLITDVSEVPDFEWLCHFGNTESMQFRLTIKKTGQTVAHVTVIGLDHYVRCWQERPIGLVNMHVDESFRGQGYGTTLLIESLRRLRSEMNITLAELHVPNNHPIAMKAIQNAGFLAIEQSKVYTRPQA